jgi:hypothetical protein
MVAGASIQHPVRTSSSHHHTTRQLHAFTTITTLRLLRLHVCYAFTSVTPSRLSRPHDLTTSRPHDLTPSRLHVPTSSRRHAFFLNISALLIVPVNSFGTLDFKRRIYPRPQSPFGGNTPAIYVNLITCQPHHVSTSSRVTRGNTYPQRFWKRKGVLGKIGSCLSRLTTER